MCFIFIGDCKVEELLSVPGHSQPVTRAEEAELSYFAETLNGNKILIPDPRMGLLQAEPSEHKHGPESE